MSARLVRGHADGDGLWVLQREDETFCIVRSILTGDGRRSVVIDEPFATVEAAVTEAESLWKEATE